MNWYVHESFQNVLSEKNSTCCLLQNQQSLTNPKQRTKIANWKLGFQWLSIKSIHSSTFSCKVKTVRYCQMSEQGKEEEMRKIWICSFILKCTVKARKNETFFIIFYSSYLFLPASSLTKVSNYFCLKAINIPVIPSFVQQCGLNSW